MPPKNYSITYTVPMNSAFIQLSPMQLAALYEPNVDIVEKLLEFSEYKEAKELIERIKK